MSKKNTTKKKTKTVTKTDNNNSPLYDDIKGIILITISILLIISIFTNGSIGIIGTTFKKYIFFILGMASYFFPFLFTFLGIAYIKSQKKLTYNKKFYGMILFVANSNFLISIITLDNYYKNSLFQAIKNLYKSNSIFHGGVISLFIAIPFEKLIGTYGLYIIIFSIYIISLVLILNNSIYEILSNFKQNRKSLKKQDKNTILKEEPINKKEYIKDVNSKIKILDFMKNTPVENIDETYKQISINNYSEDTLPEKDEKEPAIEKMLEKEIEENKENKIISYEFPSTNFLNQNLLSKMNKDDKKGLLKNAAKLEDTLLSFGVEAKVLQVSKGPSVTRYELQPKVGVKVSKIVNLADDIALNLASSGVRIEAPIPGKAAVGIEVPNSDLTPVNLREVLEDDEYLYSKAKLSFAMGKDISGTTVVSDLTKMPHLLIAGATGSGKSVCLNTLIIGVLYKYLPEEVKLLMIDPKVVELSVYNGIPHLLIPVVTDPKKASGALYWAVNEMTRRYNLFAKNNVRNIESYSELFSKGKVPEKLPLIIIIIDELADLMMVCPNEVEDYIARLSQMARAAGMHLVIATQRPSVNVITGVIKANIPSRVSFAVSSQIDSRTILDMSGAEKLIGRGDMLFLPVGSSKPLRIQGAFISEEEVEKVVEFIKSQENKIEYKEEILEEINKGTINNNKAENNNDKDKLLDEAIKIVFDFGQASTSLLQRKLKIGYNRAARIIDELEELGIISGKDGSKPRQLLAKKEDLPNYFQGNGF